MEQGWAESRDIIGLRRAVQMTEPESDVQQPQSLGTEDKRGAKNRESDAVRALLWYYYTVHRNS